MFDPENVKIAPRIAEMLAASIARGGPEDMALHEKGTMWGLLSLTLYQALRHSSAPPSVQKAAMELLADIIRLYHPEMAERKVILSLIKATGADATEFLWSAR